VSIFLGLFLITTISFRSALLYLYIILQRFSFARRMEVIGFQCREVLGFQCNSQEDGVGGFVKASTLAFSKSEVSAANTGHIIVVSLAPS
jgi:hypothetical protein